MQRDELIAIGKKFSQGLDRLKLLEACLTSFSSEFPLSIHSIDTEIGELAFFFAGMKFYIRIRITDRDVDDVGPEYRVPVGWLDWGRFDPNDLREAPAQSNFFDERGILCEVDKQEFYCDFKTCDDNRVQRALTHKLGALVGRTVASNNTL